MVHIGSNKIVFPRNDGLLHGKEGPEKHDQDWAGSTWYFTFDCIWIIPGGDYSPNISHSCYVFLIKWYYLFLKISGSIQM